MTTKTHKYFILFISLQMLIAYLLGEWVLPRNADAAQNSTLTSDEKPFIEKNTGMAFVLVEGGCYQMGDSFNDGYPQEKPIHEVCIDSFWIGKYEVTQREYQKITGQNPSKFKRGNRYPVEQVSWEDVQRFITSLNKLAVMNFRLPTEAEWEYAARPMGNGKHKAKIFLDKF